MKIKQLCKNSNCILFWRMSISLRKFLHQFKTKNLDSNPTSNSVILYCCTFCLPVVHFRVLLHQVVSLVEHHSHSMKLAHAFQHLLRMRESETSTSSYCPPVSRCYISCWVPFPCWDVLSMFVLSRWQRVSLLKLWCALVRVLFYCYNTFLDHTTNTSRKVRAQRRIKIVTWTKQSWTKHHNTTFSIELIIFKLLLLLFSPQSFRFVWRLEAAGHQILQDEKLALPRRVAARVVAGQEGGEGGVQAHQLGTQLRVEPHLDLCTWALGYFAIAALKWDNGQTKDHKGR